MKIRIPALIVAIGAFSIAYANPLTPEQALQRAMADSASPRCMQGSQVQLTCTRTFNAGGQPAVYVFSNGEGFAVLAADDIAAPVLGYSNEGVFDGELPDNMESWLANYAEMIGYARNNGVTKAYAPQYESKAPIAPICTTKWNQGAPFNNECPLIGTHRAITGCVATAMAQVMKAHNWPDQGEGRKSYYCNALGKKINMVFENTTFDWENMLDNYSSSNDEEKLAVATLMKACGYSVEMDYTTGACGAQSYNVAVALPKYFKYDQGVKYVLRDFWGATEWEDMIYAELVEGRPIYYSGANSEAGHAFVCDGYSGNGYFHINWGWGGQSDGYFLLNGLDPSSQGLGGSNAGYNSWQEVILNIKPRQEGVETPTYKWMGAYDFNFAENTVELGQDAVITSWFYNYTIDALSGTFGLKLKPAQGGDPIYLTDGSAFKNLGQRSGKGGSVKLPEDLAEGVYTVTVGFTDEDGIWHDNRTAVYAVQEYTMTVENGKAVLQANAPATVKFSEINHTPVYINTNCAITSVVSNDSPYPFYKGVCAAVLNAQGRVVMQSEMLRLDLDTNNSREYNLTVKFIPEDGVNINTEAKHYLCFIDDQGYLLSDKIEITVHPESKPVMNFTNQYMPEGVNVKEVDARNFCLMADFTCEEGYFADDVYLWIYKYSSHSGAIGNAIAGVDAGMFYLTAGEQATAVFQGDLSSRLGKGTYIGKIWCNGWVPNSLVFKVVEYDGIDSVVSDNEIVGVEYYNLQGAKVANPSSGVYVKVSTFADGSSTVEKVSLR